MKIIAGSHKGRILIAPKGQVSRPTAARAREALFSILNAQGWFDDDILVLDCFAGTGALGLEALSRGALHATFIENDRAALAALRTNIETLNETPNCSILRADAHRPPKAPQGCHLVFMDPPYGKNLVTPTLAALLTQGWLDEACMVVAEVGASEDPIVPEGFTVSDTRTYGAAKFLLLSRAR